MLGSIVFDHRVLRRSLEQDTWIGYEVEHTQTGAPAFLKALRPEFAGSQRLVQRFMEGAAAIQKVHHPDVLVIHAIGKSPDGIACILTEPLSGEQLTRYIRKTGGMGVTAVPLARKMALALAAAHEQQVAYLGFNPDCVNVIGDAAYADRLDIKLLDSDAAQDLQVGSAKSRTLSELWLGASIHPVFYMAPEQCSGSSQVDERADIYALGATLYQMFSGRIPFVGRRTDDVIQAVLHRDADPLAERCPSLPGEIAALVHQMLSKVPQQRPALRKVAEALSQLRPKTMVLPENAKRTHFGEYRVVSKIGEGGMGEVFEVRSEHTGRRAAVKTLFLDLSQKPQLVERFLLEAKAATGVSHPGVISIYHTGRCEDDGTPYIVMEYLEGELLMQRIQRKAPMLEQEVVHLGWHMAAALAATHNVGIIHRDVNPNNVMIVRDEAVFGGERAKIFDFGIAKKDPLTKAHRTRAGMVLGTERYMAPEQGEDASSVDAKADVYSLGVTLYQMVSGRFPPPSLPRPLTMPNESDGLAALLERMLEPLPSQRPSMNLVAAELERLGTMSPASAPIASAPTRHILVLGLIAGGLAGLGIGGWLLQDMLWAQPGPADLASQVPNKVLTLPPDAAQAVVTASPCKPGYRIAAASGQRVCLASNLTTVRRFAEGAPWKEWQYEVSSNEALTAEWAGFGCNPGPVRGRENAPVTCLSAHRARDYCRKEGGRLPTREEVAAQPLSYDEWVSADLKGESLGVVRLSMRTITFTERTPSYRHPHLGFRCVLPEAGSVLEGR